MTIQCDRCIAARVGTATELVYPDSGSAVEVAVGEGQYTAAAAVVGTAGGNNALCLNKLYSNGDLCLRIPYFTKMCNCVSCRAYWKDVFT